MSFVCRTVLLKTCVSCTWESVVLQFYHCGVIAVVEQTGEVAERGEWFEKDMAEGLGNTNWFCAFHGDDVYGAIVVEGWLLGWCRTKGFEWNMWVPGGVPADFGVISTELPGDRFVGIAAKLCCIIPCMCGRPAPADIAILTPLPFISSPNASWLAFWARLHFARLFWNQT